MVRTLQDKIRYRPIYLPIDESNIDILFIPVIKEIKTKLNTT